MPVFETYASRVADAAKADTPDVSYDELPRFLRKQISQILTDCIGPGPRNPKIINPNTLRIAHAEVTWRQISKLFDREVESFSFPEACDNAYKHCMKYLGESSDVNGVLSLIEVCCLTMSN